MLAAHELVWTVLNDSVMGGRSSSTILQHASSLLFSGTINTKVRTSSWILSPRLSYFALHYC